MSKFTVAGVSNLNGVVKVRFANDMSRVKVLVKGGHTDVNLLTLPEPMTKGEIVTFLKGHEMYQVHVNMYAIDEADEKYNGEPVVKAAKTAVVKTGTDKKAKVVAEAVTDDASVEVSEADALATLRSLKTRAAKKTAVKTPVTE